MTNKELQRLLIQYPDDILVCFDNPQENYTYHTHAERVKIEQVKDELVLQIKSSHDPNEKARKSCGNCVGLSIGKYACYCFKLNKHADFDKNCEDWKGK